MRGYWQKKDTSYITYFGANNLYGWAMSQYLPTGNFKWINNKVKVKVKVLLGYIPN